MDCVQEPEMDSEIAELEKELRDLEEGNKPDVEAYEAVSDAVKE